MIESISIGILLGVFSGIIPGAGNLTTMLLFFPILLSLDPLELLIMYACMASISQYIGSVPAVLLGVPGESSSVPAVIEGHSMYNKGHGQLAIIACATGSWLGTFLTVGITFLIASNVEYVLQFYYSWVQALIFILVVLAVISVSGNSIFLNCVYACLGFFLGMVGYNIELQTTFLTFNNSWLYSGLPVFVIILGLIAIPEILKINNLTTVNSIAKNTKQTVLSDLLLVYKNKITIVWSSILGYVAGFIPGLSFVAGTNITYYVSKIINRKKDKKTAQLNHLLAAETSNNVGAFSQLMPLIFFGIPIIGSEALLLSLMELKGFSFSLEHAENFLYAISFAVLITNTIGLLLSWPLAGHLVKVYSYTQYLPQISVVWIFGIVLYLGYLDYSVTYYFIVFVVSVIAGMALTNTDKIPIILLLLLQDNILEIFYRVYQIYF